MSIVILSGPMERIRMRNKPTLERAQGCRRAITNHIFPLCPGCRNAFFFQQRTAHSAKILHGKRYSRNGFTLIEVVIAVVILAAALITILGLQSSIMRRTLRDEGRQQAMLLSRSMLAAIENNIDAIDVQDKTLPANELLDTLLINAPSRLEQEKKPLFEFLAHISVEMWGIPNFKDDAMRRVRINIFTEDLPEDSFDITFFIPNEEREVG